MLVPMAPNYRNLIISDIEFFEIIVLLDLAENLS